MNASAQYKSLLEKVASRSSTSDIEQVYKFCTAKYAGAGDNLMWAAVGGLPAYLLGSQLGKEEERKKHRNYALAGAAAGFLGPKLISALVNPAAALPSVSGFDASDIRDLQLQSLD